MATVLSVVVSRAAYIFTVQGQGGVSFRVLDYASGKDGPVTCGDLAPVQ